MNSLVYYFPGRGENLTPKDVWAAGLGYAFDKGQFAQIRGVMRGPDDGKGVAITSAGDRIGYYPDQQKWLKIPGSDVWVGTWTDRAILPEELIRERSLDGHWVELGDGQQWCCPAAIARSEIDERLVWQCSLPEATTLDEEGNWARSGVLPRFAEFWRVAEAFWNEFLPGSSSDEENAGGTPEPDAEQEITFTFASLNEAAVTCLATNYRLSRAEVALLGLFNEQCTREIMLAAIDWPTAAAWLKKKASEPDATPSAPAGSDTDAGPKGEPPITDQL